MLCVSQMKAMSYKLFTNRDCEFFPCHDMPAGEEFNCLFCFCPLYRLNDSCGGNFTYQGKIKDCSSCLLPHKPDGYTYIINKLVNEMEV